MIGRALGEAKHAAKRVLGRASSVVWREALSRQDTTAFLSGFEIQVIRNRSIALPALAPAAGRRPSPFAPQQVTFEPQYVWRITKGDDIRAIGTAASGTVLLNERLLLDTDFGAWAGLVEAPRRPRACLDIVVAPWSHRWATYFDYLMFVAAKLCRIREMVDAKTWAQVRVCYALQHTPFERQLLAGVGLSSSSVIDTTRYAISAETLLTANSQQSWAPSPTNIRALRRAFVRGPAPATGRRIYVSRNGRRKVRNEQEVRNALGALGIETIEEMPASLDAQIKLFRSASLIVSPHGSALANLVWCEPDTRVIELLSSGFAWNYFYYLSQVVGLRYSYLVDHSRRQLHWTNVADDVTVDIEALKTEIERCTE